MDKQSSDQLDAELKHAGEATQLSPQMLLLEQLRITPEKKLPKMDFLFRLFDTPCFPRRELVAITGKAKSGKTFVSSMLIACCQKRDVLSFHREQEQPLRVLWYDTEQSDESTQDILKNRVVKMTGGTPQPTLFEDADERPSPDVFNVRAVEWKKRRSLLIEAINMCKPDLVIVDGIRDLVNDINDGVLAQEVMEELLHLASKADCCIACVLHQNKSGEDHNLRGWIGTELMNKAFEIYSCEKLTPELTFEFKQENSRKYDILQKLYFKVNGEGLPEETVSNASTNTNTKSFTGKRPRMNQKYDNHYDDGDLNPDLQKLFLGAMRGREEIGGGELRTEVCKLGKIVNYKYYNKLLERALDEKIIIRTERDRHVFYQPAPF